MPAIIILPEPDDIAENSESDQIINIGPDPKLNIMHAKRNKFINGKCFIEYILINMIIEYKNYNKLKLYNYEKNNF